MQTEPQLEKVPPVPASLSENRMAVEAAAGWLTRFAPLLDLHEPDADACRKWLRDLPELQVAGQSVCQALQNQACQADLVLISTLQDALGELGSSEAELRSRLATLAPGDPLGQADLGTLRAKLAQSAARREVATISGPSVDTPAFKAQTGYPNTGAAIGLSVIAVAWTCGTTAFMFNFAGDRGPGFFEITFQIPFALAGVFMLWQGLKMAIAEYLTLEGEQLTIRRRLWGLEWVKHYCLGPEAKAYVSVTRSNEQETVQVAIRDGNGNLINLSSGGVRAEMDELVETLNSRIQLFQSSEALH